MISWKVQHLDQVTSTQDLVRDYARQGVPEGWVVIADQQTKGRGRQGRAWISPKGNLYCSILIRPEAEDRATYGLYAYVVAVALVRTMRLVLPQPIRPHLKWPNDVYLGEKKCAGILLESETDGTLVIGVGINVATPPPNAVALNQFATKTFRPRQVLTLFLGRLNEVRQLYLSYGFAPVRDEWKSLARGLKQPIEIKSGYNTYKGVFSDIGNDGALLLELNDGSVKPIHAGEVFF